MTQQEAEALAAKREAHKGKSLSHMRWQAVHDPVKGWGTALVPINVVTPPSAPDLSFRDAVVLHTMIFGVDATLRALRGEFDQ